MTPQEKYELRQRAEAFARRAAEQPRPLVVERSLHHGHNQATQFDKLAEAEVALALRVAIATLPDRTVRILRMRFGLDGKGSHTLEQIGRRFRLSKDRIRQIEARALRMLRHPSKSDAIAEAAFGSACGIQNDMRGLPTSFVAFASPIPDLEIRIVDARSRHAWRNR